MSTNTHEQSKTCTDIVNGVTWLREGEALLAAALRSAAVPATSSVADWEVRRTSLRHAEDGLVRHMAKAAANWNSPVPVRWSTAVPVLQREGWKWDEGRQEWVCPPPFLARHPGAAAAVLTLQTGGWTYKVGDERWAHPGTYGQDSGVLAAEELRRQGYAWSVNLAVWMPPAPSADAQRANAAEATLGGLGYEWAPKRQAWVNTRVAPVKPDVQ